jgi:hypothetical protein
MNPLFFNEKQSGYKKIVDKVFEIIECWLDSNIRIFLGLDGLREE